MFRLSAHADPAFLAEMLYEAVNWFDDGAEERPAMEDVLAVPENALAADGVKISGTVIWAPGPTATGSSGNDCVLNPAPVTSTEVTMAHFSWPVGGTISSLFGKRMRRHVEGMRRCAAANNVDYELLTTKQPLDFALFSFLSRRAGK